MRRLIIFGTLLASFLVTSAVAQGVDQRRGRERSSPEMRERRMRETVELYMMLRIKEELALTAEQENHVMPLLREHLSFRRDAGLEKRRLSDELRRMIDGESYDEGRASEILERLRDMEEQHYLQKNRLQDELSEHLQVKQQAQLVFFMDRFSREMQDRVREIKRMRREARQRDRPGPGQRRSTPDRPPR
jgi:hypothetical protein